jgi:acyl-CoA thioester hydrolase
MISARAEVRVRYAETDAMGVAHHSSYVAWLEFGRIHLLDECKLPYRTMEKEGFHLPVLDLQITYKQPCRFDDRLEIETYLDEIPGVRFTMKYRIWKAGEVIAAGSTQHAFVGGDGQPVRPPAFFKQRLREIWVTQDDSW